MMSTVAVLEAWSPRPGQRTLAGIPRVGSTRIIKASEVGMSFMGFLPFPDALELGVGATIRRLGELGVSFLPFAALPGAHSFASSALALLLLVVVAHVMAG